VGWDRVVHQEAELVLVLVLESVKSVRLLMSVQEVEVPNLLYLAAVQFQGHLMAQEAARLDRQRYQWLGRRLLTMGGSSLLQAASKDRSHDCSHCRSHIHYCQCHCCKISIVFSPRRYIVKLTKFP
jgi:hypothetical protein